MKSVVLKAFFCILIVCMFLFPSMALASRTDDKEFCSCGIKDISLGKGYGLRYNLINCLIDKGGLLDFIFSMISSLRFTESFSRIKSSGIRSTLIDDVDQEQTTADDFVAIYGDKYYAQSFTPQKYGLMTRIEILIEKNIKTINMGISERNKIESIGPLYFSIRNSLDGRILASMIVQPEDISEETEWITFNISYTKIELGKEYYIVVHQDGGDKRNYYKWYYGNGNPYKEGKGYYLAKLGDEWEELVGSDFCFRSYGLEDTEPPSKVTGLKVVDAHNGKLSLSWDPANDNVGVDHYNIYRDNMFLTTVKNRFYQDTGLTNGQSYTYQVSAVDTSGNEGEKSDPVSGIPTYYVEDMWAVVIGTRNDPNGEEIYADEDAEAMYSILLDNGWNVIKLIDCTMEETKNALNIIERKEDRDDVVLFYFAGHGGSGDLDGDGEKDESSIFFMDGAFGARGLDEIFDGFESERIVIIIEACGSGGFIHYQYNLKDSNRLILTSSDAGELTWASKKLKRGYFNYYFVKGLGCLADKNNDNSVSAEEAFEYTKPKIIHKQTPQIYDGNPNEDIILTWCKEVPRDNEEYFTSELDLMFLPRYIFF